jgi:phosphate transport system permease protein
MIPVATLGAIVAMIVVRSMHSINRVGLSDLFGDEFSSQYGTGKNIFGLLPAITGTINVTVLAVAIALPVSLAMALISTEFTLPVIGRAMRLLLGTLAGVPSIVYALSAVIFVKWLIIPKFAADSTFNTFTPDKVGYHPACNTTACLWPPHDVPFSAGGLPWDATGLNNSTLLGGALIALLVIPFLAPLIEDAIRSVPQAPREASLALGTSRWHTFRRVVFPHAAPGIVSATALATLKAMGDTMIVVFVIGFESAHVPKPFFDVFERSAPLSAVGADLLGGFQGLGGCTGARCDTGYFTAFLLLGFAIAVVIVSFVLQARLRARLAR